MVRKFLPIIIAIILLLAAFTFWGISKNFFVINRYVTSKMVSNLRDVNEIVVGKYYLQTVVDQREIKALPPDVKILFRVEWEANVTIDFSKIRPEDIVINKESKIISVRIPAPEFTKLSMKNPELIYEKVPFYRNDEEIRNQVLQYAKNDVQNRLKKLRNSKYNILLVQSFVKNFVRKTLGEEYNVTVTFGS